MLTSSTAFDVTKGEDAPEIGATGPVTGVAYKDCSWKVPYKVDNKYKWISNARLYTYWGVSTGISVQINNNNTILYSFGIHVEKISALNLNFSIDFQWQLGKI